MIHVKRVYESPSKRDGLRILVERLWPRGVSKARAKVDIWLLDAAPSPELRRWFSHDPATWEEFCARYWKELGQNKKAVVPIEQSVKHGAVTLIYSARDKEHNSAVALKRFLERRKGVGR